MQMIIISGLSGAGKSTAGEFLEDEGFYTIDNMPALLMPRFAELCLSGSGGYDKVAMVSDIRGGKNFDELFCALDTMREMGIDCKLLFLEASVPAIIKRFKETRRIHPLEGGTVSLSQAVEGEKLLLAPVRERADYIIDSTNFANNGQLRSVLRQMFGTSSERMHLRVNVQSFGYKYGLPLEADLVWDVRFLPNPFYEKNLRSQTGLDEPVREFLFRYDETKTFLAKCQDMLAFLLPLYEAEGKSTLVLAVGCTGGQHRSVAMAHALSEIIRELGYQVAESHRDMTRERK